MQGTEEEKLCGNPKMLQGCGLSRHGTHPQLLSVPVRAATAADQEGRGTLGRKKRRAQERGAALAALHHRLLLWKGGRGVHGGKGGAALPVTASVHAQNLIFMT